MLEAETIEEQQEIYNEHLKSVSGPVSIRFIMNRDNHALDARRTACPAQAGRETYNGKMARFVEDCLDTVFAKLPIHDNYFWRVYMTGSYTRTCCPEYLKRENFDQLKGGLVDRITTHTNTVEGFLRENDVPISRFVLLDHMDWLSDHMFEALVGEWNAIIESAAPNARIIWRSGGMETDYLNRVNVQVDGVERPLPELLKLHPEKSRRTAREVPRPHLRQFLYRRFWCDSQPQPKFNAKSTPWDF